MEEAKNTETKDNGEMFKSGSKVKLRRLAWTRQMQETLEKKIESWARRKIGYRDRVQCRMLDEKKKTTAERWQRW